MTRARGFADWSPRAETVALLDDVRDVLHTYRDHLPLTVRQVFYRLVATTGYAKDEKAYARLCEHLVRARRAGLISFDVLRDDGVADLAYAAYSSPAQFVDELVQQAQHYSRNMQDDQACYVELWCEAEGMMPQLARVAAPYTVPVYSAGGFLSVTATYEIAKRALRRRVPTVLLHIGDYDPSGESIFTALAEDVAAFVQDHDGIEPIAQRVALTGDQVERHHLPTAPPKRSDSRTSSWTGQTCQCESLPPDLLAQYAGDAIFDHLDQDVLDDHQAAERRERAQLVERLAAL